MTQTKRAYVESVGQSELQMPSGTSGGATGGSVAVPDLIVVEALAPGTSVFMIAVSVGTSHAPVQSTTGELMPQLSSKANATRIALKPSILHK